MRGHLHLVPNLRKVARDQHLQPIGFGDEATQLLLIGRHDIGLDRGGVTERVPVFASEGFLDTVE